jgi:hypothetical protein
MIGPGEFDSRLWTAAAIGLALAISTVRLILWRRSAPRHAQSPEWRLGLLLALQLAAGMLLYLVLFPPGAVLRTGDLIVATVGAPQAIERQAGDVLVALPEAGVVSGATRVPDLATAVRRFPGAARIRIEGAGLPPRDQAPPGRPVRFDPPPPPRGLVELALPEPVAPGAVFSVGGRVGSLAAGTVELVDPAEAVVARARIVAGQRFTLTSHTRAPGLALFELRLRDAAGGLVERIAAPVEARAQLQPRVLVLAGAPSAETKYLRRWAEDADIDLNLRIDLGAGVQIGDEAAALGRAALNDIDLVVIDDRRWAALSASDRAALVSAVDAGLGLLLRPTGPLAAEVRRDWAAMGLAVAGGGDGRPVRLAPAPAAPDAGADTNGADLPELTRRDLASEGPRLISTVRDADGVALAGWRSRGLGRIGIWTVADTYALVLTGNADRYAEIWSDLFSALARAQDVNRISIDGLARAGSRVSICQVSDAAMVVGPDGVERPLRVDPATGAHACAAYWPTRPGWHRVRSGEAGDRNLYVHPPTAAPSLSASANRQATIELTATPATGVNPSPLPRAPGSPWPWFMALLLVLAALWWLERNPGPKRAQSDPDL